VLGLNGTEKVLEVGTGSGYQTVLLAHLAGQVFSVERIAPLLDVARNAVRASGVSNVSLMLGDGTYGWKAFAPYDAILVSAASPNTPQPLLDQLAEGGRMLIPVGGRNEQRLILITKRGTTLEREYVAPVKFVPLVGDHGWSEGAEGPKDQRRTEGPEGAGGHGRTEDR
jgi:protein-L-isoaspartate(D-aspartate) O-methyltransferase